MAQEINKNELKVSQSMMMHMAFGKCHQGKYECTCHMEGHPIDGFKFIHETYTPKNKWGEFGKQQNMYYTADGKSKTYTDAWELIKDENEKL
jgi:hypothetical protein